MKTKLLIIAGLLVIAFAVMITPVMAGNTIAASGEQGSQYTLSVGSSTTDFGTFSLGQNFNTANSVTVTTNDGTWSLTASGDKMISGSTYLTDPISIKNQTDLSASGITGEAIPVSITSGGQQFVTGTSSQLTGTTIPLYLGQFIHMGDPKGSYSTTITISYAGSG